MADTCVLVPMQLDVMVLPQAATDSTPFLRTQMTYSNLRSFQPPDPVAFEGADTDQPDPGIYLHWTLPQALRHGLQENAATSFPFVPNRWLVARVIHGQPAAQSVKAWIIESDYYGSDGTSPYIDPSGLQNGLVNPVGLGRARLLAEVPSLPSQPNPFLKAISPGSVYFSAYEPGVQNVLAFLDRMTAVGVPPDDKEKDAPVIDRATITYYVAGWYSDAAMDPLSGTTWQANTDPSLPGTYLNSTLPWYVYADSADLPTRTIVHAMSSGVTWDASADYIPPPSYPTNTPSTVQVAVGSTAIDALAGIVAQNSSQTEADLLAAFQYNLLDQFDQPGSSEALNMAIREYWFDGSPGGTIWTVVANEVADTSLPNPPPPPLTTDQQAALAALNVAQRELDRQQRVLSSMQWTLFGLWWMNQWQQSPLNGVPDPAPSDWLSVQLPLQVGVGSDANDPDGTDPSQEGWYAWKVLAQQNLVAQLTTNVTAATTTLTELLGSTLSTKATNAPQFYAPRDPVVMITGLGRATNFDPSEGILCRLPSQTVKSLTVGGRAYSAGSVAAQVPVLADPNNVLPDGIQALNVENLFLSPPLFAQVVMGNANQSNVTAVETAIGALPAPSAGGQFPPLSFAAQLWVQPWVPLLLEWQVTVLNAPAYMYTVTMEDGNPIDDESIWRFQPATWQFAGADPNQPAVQGIDYQWIGPTETQPQDPNNPTRYPPPNLDEATSLNMQLSGRTFITPQATIALSAQLDQYVQTHSMRDPDLEALLTDLRTRIDAIAGQDILSQRLSGLLGQMLQRGGGQTIAPSGDITALLGNAQHGIPMPFPDDYSNMSPPPWTFAPLSGTFFVINKLTVVDAFGRSIDVLLSNNSTAPSPLPPNTDNEDYFFPIAGRCVQSPTGESPAKGKGISTDPTKRMLALPPRAIQPSRLAFTLLSNDGTDTDITLLAGANPICGWVVPNHLDRSLALYAPDGTAWGELYLSHHTGETFVAAWQPDPTNLSAPQSVAEIPNRFVSGMLQAIMGRSDNGTTFSDLLLGIDRSLWTINPPGDRNDLDLDVLVGRPLAIVRAELTLGLNGLPVTSQDWWNLFAFDPFQGPPGDGTQAAELAAIDGGVGSYLWPVRLGSQALRDDGLIGYFADNPANPAETYAQLNVVTLPDELQSTYLQPIDQSSYPWLRFVDDSVATPDPTRQQVCRLTMLVDPRGSVHAFSGLLPVVSVGIPSQFVTPALKTISYVFRAGPLLTIPDAVRVPRPAASKGNWAWFDNVLAAVTTLSPSDGKAAIATTPPLVKEGWLKFTPNPPTPPTSSNSTSNPMDPRRS